MPPKPRIRASVPEPSLTPGPQKSVVAECWRLTEWLRGAAPGEGGRRAAHSSGGGEAVNVAVAVASPPRLRVQSPLPEAPPPLQAPPHPSKMKPLPAVAVSVTEVPAPKSAAQVEESQSSPDGEEVTRPFPWTMTVRWCLVGSVRPDPPPELDPHPATRPATTQTRMNARIASPHGSLEALTLGRRAP